MICRSKGDMKWKGYYSGFDSLGRVGLLCHSMSAYARTSRRKDKILPGRHLGLGFPCLGLNMQGAFRVLQISEGSVKPLVAKYYVRLMIDRVKGLRFKA